MTPTPVCDICGYPPEVDHHSQHQAKGYHPFIGAPTAPVTPTPDEPLGTCYLGEIMLSAVGHCGEHGQTPQCADWRPLPDRGSSSDP